MIVEYNRCERGKYKGQLMFRIKAHNGRIICSSEYYHNDKDCVNAVHSVVYGRSWVFRGLDEKV